MKRLIAVGDIHGQHHMLLTLMADIEPSNDDQIVFLGDYIDRGEESPAILDWLLSFKQQYPKTICLRGNHEQMLLDAVAAAQRKIDGRNTFLDDFMAIRGQGLPVAISSYMANGGMETLAAYNQLTDDFDPCSALCEIPRAHIEFLSNMPYFWQCRHFFFVHAGVDPKDPTGEKRGMEAFLWQRKSLWTKDSKWDKVVVHGHTPVAKPQVNEMEINLDTGAGYGKVLTACDLLQMRFWQASPDTAFT